jgi:hypothetical protein
MTAPIIYLNVTLVTCLLQLRSACCRLPPAMSKNTSSTTFRKVNVDQYDEDNFEDEALATEQIDGINAAVLSQSADVQKLLSADKKVDALRLALSNPPLKTTDKAIKVCLALWIPCIFIIHLLVYATEIRRRIEMSPTREAPSVSVSAVPSSPRLSYSSGKGLLERNSLRICHQGCGYPSCSCGA